MKARELIATITNEIEDINGEIEAMVTEDANSIILYTIPDPSKPDEKHIIARF